MGSSSLKTSLVSVYNGESNANDSYGSNNGTERGGLTYTTGKIGIPKDTKNTDSDSKNKNDSKSDSDSKKECMGSTRQIHFLSSIFGSHILGIPSSTSSSRSNI